MFGVQGVVYDPDPCSLPKYLHSPPRFTSRSCSSSNSRAPLSPRTCPCRSSPFRAHWKASCPSFATLLIQNGGLVSVQWLHMLWFPTYELLALHLTRLPHPQLHVFAAKVLRVMFTGFTSVHALAQCNLDTALV